jgi:hypothetical protein
VKRFFFIASLLLGCLGTLIPIRAATVTGNLRLITGAAHPDKRVVFTPDDTPRQTSSGTVLWTPTQVTSSDGVFTVVLGQGSYRVSIDGILWSRICVPAGDGVYSMHSAGKELQCGNGTAIWLADTNELYRVKVSSTDTNAAFLASKLTAGSNMTVTTTGAGADEKLEISAAGGPSLANPTASVGLSAVNGTSTNAMRADAAPALNVAIAPTWTGQHIFDVGLKIGASTTGSWGEAIASIRDEANEDPYNGIYIESKYAAGSAYWSMFSDVGRANTQIAVLHDGEPDSFILDTDIEVGTPTVRLHMIHRNALNNATTLWDFNPYRRGVAAAAYTLNGLNLGTNDVLQVQHNGTNQFTVSSNSGYTGAGTKYLTDDGTYKTVETESSAGTGLQKGDGSGGFASASSADVQAALGQVYQATNANLTAWAAIAPSAKQDASANLTSWSALAPSAKQDADTDLNSLAAGISGLVKGAGNGAGYSAAAAGTDYAPATSGTSILKGNGSGGFANAAAGTDYQAVLGFTPLNRAGDSASGEIYAPILSASRFQAYQASLTHAGTVTLDFDATTTTASITLTGNVTFAFSNLATNRNYRLLVKNTQSTNCTITWPSGIHGYFTTTSSNATWMMASMEAWGTAATDVWLSTSNDGTY